MQVFHRTGLPGPQYAGCTSEFASVTTSEKHVNVYLIDVNDQLHCEQAVFRLKKMFPSLWDCLEIGFPKVRLTVSFVKLAGSQIRSIWLENLVLMETPGCILSV
jgi:hypothetical protein